MSDPVETEVCTDADCAGCAGEPDCHPEFVAPECPRCQLHPPLLLRKERNKARAELAWIRGRMKDLVATLRGMNNTVGTQAASVVELLLPESHWGPCRECGKPWRTCDPECENAEPKDPAPSARTVRMLERAKVAASTEVQTHLDAGREVYGRRDGVPVVVKPKEPSR